MVKKTTKETKEVKEEEPTVCEVNVTSELDPTTGRINGLIRYKNKNINLNNIVDLELDVSDPSRSKVRFFIDETQSVSWLFEDEETAKSIYNSILNEYFYTI